MTHLILVAPPRSGASLLAACLQQDPRWSSTPLSNADIDHRLGARVENNGLSSHRWASSTLTPRERDDLTDLAQRSTDFAVDWNPRLSLRVGAMAEALPDATFVVVARPTVPTIASLMQAWSSQRFVSVPDLPEWWGDQWSFPLIPGWKDLIGEPAGRICTRQWAAIAEALVSDLSALPRDRWVVASYEGLVADPESEVRRLAAATGTQWEAELPDPLPVTATVVTPPSDATWHASWSEIEPALDDDRAVMDAYTQLLTSARPDLTWTHEDAGKGEDPGFEVLTSLGTQFQSSATDTMARILDLAASSLVITTYKSGHVILGRSQGDKLNTEFMALPRPMGVAASGSRLAIGTDDAIASFTRHSGVAASVPTPVPSDAPFIHRAIVKTGDIAIHDMAYDGDGELIFVNTLFSCLCRQDVNYSFAPIWRPSWISGLADEDRCHLNGLAMVDGQPKYVTALAQTDTRHGWREMRGTGGVIVDIDTDEVIAEGLSMPHSPRWHDGRLWVLESGRGELNTVDHRTGRVETIATLPGFTRGLSFIGPYALVGLSQVRESVFQSLPITQTRDERNCGVWLVDTRTGSIDGWLKFEGVVQEIFEVAVLPFRWPVIVEDASVSRDAFVLADDVLRDVMIDSDGSGTT